MNAEIETETLISPELMKSLQETIANLKSGKRDEAAIQAACARMDRSREEDRARNGVKDFGVEAIRELRDDPHAEYSQSSVIHCYCK